MALVFFLVLVITGTTLATNQSSKHKLADPVLLQEPTKTASAAQDLTIKSLVSTSMVPGAEARYTIAFTVPASVELKGALFTLKLPASFSMIKNDILDENPGCTLANLQYKNSGSRYSYLQGETETALENDQTIFKMNVTSKNPAVVNEGIIVYLTFPGIINAADEGNYAIQISLKSGSENYEGQTDLCLGAAPKEAPTGLKIKAEDSYTFKAQWDSADKIDNPRYQLYYALDPNGVYIQACDFGHDPSYPGEQWQLNDTSCKFTAKGNGGLEPGRTYYFKVRAGNEFGFGPFSKVIKAETPVIRLKAPEENLHSPIQLRVDQNVEIADEDLIILFEADSGVPVPAQVTANGSIISIDADLESGTRYQVVFYKDALVGTDTKANNNLFGFEFVAGSQPSK